MLKVKDENTMPILSFSEKNAAMNPKILSPNHQCQALIIDAIESPIAFSVADLVDFLTGSDPDRIRPF